MYEKLDNGDYDSNITSRFTKLNPEPLNMYESVEKFKLVNKSL